MKPDLAADLTTVPMQDFLSVLEDLHAAIGVAVGIQEPTRQLLLGRIDGYRTRYAAFEPNISRQDALNLIYATRRAAKFAERNDLSVNERKQKIRETMGEQLKRPTAAK